MADKSITDPRTVFETLTTKVRSLGAMLEMTYGEAQEQFEARSRELRADYMQACAGLAHECRHLLEPIGSAIYAKEASHD